MGLKRGTQPKAARAVRRSADAPKPSKPARKEKAHAPVAAKPARPRKLKPAPPVFDCLKCQKLAAEKREVTRLRREVERMIGLDHARVQAALAGRPAAISDAEIAEAIQSAYAPAFAQILQVPVTIALSCAEDAGDRLKAVQMVTERVAGKVTDKLEHTLRVQVDLSRASDEEVAILERAQQIIARLSGKAAA